MATSRPARITFTGTPDGRSMIVKTLNPDANDTSSKITRRAGTHPIAQINFYSDPTYAFGTVTYGAARTGTRYRAFRTLTDARDYLVKWAGRRFRLPLDA